MEIFGSTFDDSVFEESRAKPTVVALSTYNAKFCEAEVSVNQLPNVK